MENIRKKVRPHHVVSILAVGGIAFAALYFTGKPLFSSADSFVLFAGDRIQLGDNVQVSSGDVGSNLKVDIGQDILINGNLFADTISIDANTTINGNASFNKLQIDASSAIIGTTSTTVPLPIAILPIIPDFSIGTRDLSFDGPDNTLAPGDYRNVTLAASSSLTLSGGIYHLKELRLGEGSTLIFFRLNYAQHQAQTQRGRCGFHLARTESQATGSFYTT